MPKHLEHINKMAAGIDIGSQSHFVAVPEGCTEVCVREFKSFTTDLSELADWLNDCGIETVAMESTGVYWIPLFELLESRGFDVKLVDARHVKNVSGRKDGCFRLPMVTTVTHVRFIERCISTSRTSLCVTRLFMSTQHVS